MSSGCVTPETEPGRLEAPPPPTCHTEIAPFHTAPPPPHAPPPLHTPYILLLLSHVSSPRQCLPPSTQGHGGSCFMTFHRAWLLEFEAALLSVSPSGVFPRPLETPCDNPHPPSTHTECPSHVPLFHTQSPPLPMPLCLPLGSWWVMLHDIPQSLAAGV
jgi:hypothetical protein